jgi:hypothetical protein
MSRRCTRSGDHFALSHDAASLSRLSRRYCRSKIKDVMRTGISGQLEQFVAYAGSATIAIARYGPTARGYADHRVPAFWNTFSIFRRTGIVQSRILGYRRTERSSPSLPQPSSHVACGRAQIWT